MDLWGLKIPLEFFVHMNENQKETPKPDKNTSKWH